MGFWSFITGVDIEDAQRRDDAARLAHDELNRARYGEDYAPLESYDFEAEVQTEFTDEVAARADALRGGADSIIGGTLGTFFRLVPVWAWIAAAAVALFYLWPVIGPRVKKILS